MFLWSRAQQISWIRGHPVNIDNVNRKFQLVGEFHRVDHTTPIHKTSSDKSRPELAVPDSTDQSRVSQENIESKYVAIDPSGTEIQITKELFVALLDFMQTRKSPGS